MRAEPRDQIPRPEQVGSVTWVCGAPVYIDGWDETRQVWLAHRHGPSFVWVQGYADAYLSTRIFLHADLLVAYLVSVATWPRR